MAANKFATMLHRNTHKLVVVLTYAILEWVLILLLLVNSTFTYLIVKFANYFGLKPPCLWCSRVDHVLEPGKSANSYRELVCDVHANEISKLGYCWSHRRLAESEHMCIDCLASLPNQNNEAGGITGSISFISLMAKDKLEDVEKVVCRCSCCNGSLGSKFCPPYLLFKSSWGALNYNRKGNSISEAVDGESNEEGEHKEYCSRLHSPEICSEDDYEIKGNDGEENLNDKSPADEYHQLSADVECFGIREEVEEAAAQTLNNAQKEFSGMNYQSTSDILSRICSPQDDSLKIMDLGFERANSCDLDRVITIELIDAATTANQGSCNSKREYLRGSDHQNENSDPVLQVETEGNVLGEALLLGADVREEEPESFQIDHAVPGGSSDKEEAAAIEETDGYTEEISRQLTLLVNERNPQNQEPAHTFLNTQQEESLKIDNTDAEISASPEAPLAGNEFDANHTGKDYQAGINDHLSIQLEPTNDAEEEKLPDTPTSLDGLHYLHKKLLLLEKRDSGAEDSLDGSVLSEMEGGDPVLTIERLRASVNAERRALRTLYAELEEERSAAAIAANQTMAMITRLQEEKAAMQMEALQYQRMMEEQSEYDQEALQLLNELMIKREKEKQELEKELEIYRIKVSEYETKEELRLMRSSKDGSITGRNSYVSCSYTDDGDDLSIDLNRDTRDEDSSICCNHDCSINSTPADTVLSLEEVALDCVKHMTALDDSLAEFEEEKLFILDQLKALEEKLIRIDNGEEANSIEHSLEYKVDEHDEYRDCSSPEENGVSMDKSYHERKTMVSMAKSLLPLLEATPDSESEEKFIHSENAISESAEVELDSNKLAIIEEVDHVYERLQALETDREFLKHCMSSIEKGDKGMNLLQEILQHLRDLRAVELRVQSLDNVN
ncbi:myosin-binding protein 3-like isoform X2 [Tripterygium wilfordii]|uniref:myosin-binding protein 3-like isoform X2 n=1 Tax=Tripterygium wilfordii TaxID=458696 RepID=UPI0018F7F879|nr:myosin-binding protein 3-like isoform X2 [Tripterygium wilfordii]